MFKNQLSSVVEWNTTDKDALFYKWRQDELKKGSVLIVRMGQKAVFFNNGVIDGEFDKQGRFDIESEIVPFLSSLKGLKFGFNSGYRAEVLFINTKGIVVNWGTKQPVNIMAQGLPGGVPVRANGTYIIHVADPMKIMTEISGEETFRVQNAKDRLDPFMDQLLLQHITREGGGFFNMMANSGEIGKAIEKDLDEKMEPLGIKVSDVSIASLTYPKEVQDMITKVAAQSMIGGNMATYQQVAFTDNMSKNGTGMGGQFANMSAGWAMGRQMAQNMVAQPQPVQQQPVQQAAPAQGGENFAGAKFCPNCGKPLNGSSKFCPECGFKLQ